MLSTLRNAAIITALLACCLATNAWSKPKSIECPKVVADKASGIFYPGKLLRCYKDSKAAKSAGYAAVSSLSSKSYTGWWRFALNPKSDSCGELGPQDWNPLTLFLQVKQKSAGVFAEFCPGQTKLVGSTELTSNGFSVASLETLQNDSSCGPGKAEVRYIFEAKKLNSVTNHAASVRYSRIKTCADPAYGEFSCSTIWEGQGWREEPNHKFWPTVPENTAALSQSCNEALSKCSGCHIGL